MAVYSSAASDVYKRQLYVFLGTLGADAVPLYGDVMLQGVIDTIAKRPLFGCVFLRIHPGGQEKQAGEE